MANSSSKIRLTLSPQAEKYVRRDAPVEARRMAARGALPLEPIELATVLFALQHDSDQEVKDRARESLEQLPDHLLNVILSGPTHPAVLSFLAHANKDSEDQCEKIALNPAADNGLIAFLATLPHRRVVDIISNNQERMLRCDEIVESLGANPLTGRAVIERILNFLGVSTKEQKDDLQSAGEVDKQAAEAAVLAMLGDGMADVAKYLSAESEEEVEDEETKVSLFSAVQKMTVMQKIKLTRIGGKEARGLLIRDRNKVVATAAISSPKITESEAAGYAQSRNLCDEVLRIIATNREWTRNYQVKLALATNPRCPQTSSINFVNYLQERDLRAIMKSKDVPSAIAAHARRLLQKKGKI